MDMMFLFTIITTAIFLAAGGFATFAMGLNRLAGSGRGGWVPYFCHALLLICGALTTFGGVFLLVAPFR